MPLSAANGQPYEEAPSQPRQPLSSRSRPRQGSCQQHSSSALLCSSAILLSLLFTLSLRYYVVCCYRFASLVQVVSPATSSSRYRPAAARPGCSLFPTEPHLPRPLSHLPPPKLLRHDRHSTRTRHVDRPRPWRIVATRAESRSGRLAPTTAHLAIAYRTSPRSATSSPTPTMRLLRGPRCTRASH